VAGISPGGVTSFPPAWPGVVGPGAHVDATAAVVVGCPVPAVAAGADVVLRVAADWLRPLEHAAVTTATTRRRRTTDRWKGTTRSYATRGS
jgi:hypothetical protein